MVSLIIPCFNEEKRLGKSLEKLKEFLKDFNQEIEVIIVDDGSSDNTYKLALSYAPSFKNLKVIALDRNRGKGAAVNRGFQESGGEIVVFTDADFSTPISEINKLLIKINEGNDIVIGSRALDRSSVKKHQKFLREMMGRTFNLFVKLLAVRGISDTQCGFKAFYKPTCTKVFERQTIFDFGFDVEILFIARKFGLKIAEVPVLWYNDERSSVNPIKDSVKTLYDLAKIRLVHAGDKLNFFDQILYQFYQRRTLVKFVAVGLSGTFVDYFTYIVLTRFLKLSPLEANPLSVEIAIVWNFTFNNLWTFSSRENQKKLFHKFITFQFVSFGGLMLSQTQILLFTVYFSFHDLLAKALSLPAVAVFNYLVNSRWTFKDQTSKNSFSIVYLLLILLLFGIYLLLAKQLLGSFIFFGR